MAQPRTIILRAPGTNCDRETAFAFEQAGGRADIVHVNRVLENPDVLAEYQILCIPGGFSYGDDIAAGRILGNQIEHHLADAFSKFRGEEKLILGICNGFQVLLKSGVFVDLDSPLAKKDRPTAIATLAWNDSGKFEDRWVRLTVAGENCVFLRDIEQMYLPVAHAEGKFVTRDEAAFEQLAERGQLAIKYAGNGCADVPYPQNPNGSQGNVAGICDASGLVFGLMPHPERYIDRTQHPRWTRGEGSQPGDGLQIFENAVDYFG